MKLVDYTAIPGEEVLDDVLYGLLDLLSDGVKENTKEKLWQAIKRGDYKNMKNIENFSVEFIPGIPDLNLSAVTEVTFKAKVDFQKEIRECRKSLLTSK